MTTRRLWPALAVALVVLVVGPLASADAAPTVAIGSPASGTSSREPVQLLSGSSSDTLDSVSVRIFQGVGTSGTQLPALEPVTPVGGAWSTQTPALADGTYTAFAEQQESGTTETGVSQDVTFTVDTVAPTVTLGAVAAATHKSTPGFAGSASEASGDVGSVSVIVYAGSSVGGKVEASGTAPVSGGAWSYISSALADGTYTVVASEGDEAGNVGTSSSATFVVDTVAPAASINTFPSVTGNSAPSFGGVAGEASGDGAVHVFVHKGSSASGELAVPEATATSSAGKWSWSSSHLIDGTYTVQAQQADVAGNVTKTSAETFRVDTTPPSLSVATPKEDEALKSSRPTFSGSTSNATGDQTEVTIEIFESPSGMLAQKLAVNRSGSSWSTGSSGPRLPNGTYTVLAKQTDSVGNLGTSAPVKFSIESPSPTVTLNALPPFIGSTEPAFSGGAQSAEAAPAVTLNIWRGTSASGTVVESVSAPESGGLWSVPAVAALSEGTYTAQAEQADVTTHNPAGVSAATTFTVDTTAPTVTLDAPPESTGLETVSGIAGLAPGDRRQVTAELFQGSGTEPGAAIETIIVNDNQADGTWSATFAGLAGGQYTVLAKQSDEAGNTGQSQAQGFTVVAPPAGSPETPAAPSPPVASFTWVPSSPTVGQSVSLASNSTGASSPIGSFAWDVGSGQLVAAGPSTTTSFATPGAHVVRLQVTDANGLSSIATRTIDVSAQALKLMQPFPIVRIAGSESSSGVRVKLLSVQAPATTKVSVTCKGRGCKTKSESRLATASSKTANKPGGIVLAFPRFQRALRAGAVLQIRVSKAGEIGKYTSFTIRRNKLPVRVDACLRPTSSNPSPCPTQ